MCAPAGATSRLMTATGFAQCGQRATAFGTALSAGTALPAGTASEPAFLAPAGPAIRSLVGPGPLARS